MQVVDAAAATAPLRDADRWEVTLGRALLLCRRGDIAAAATTISEEQTELTVQMGPPSLESYARCHPLMVRLHMLEDLQSLGARARAGSSHQERKSALQGAVSRVDKLIVDVASRTRMLELLRALAALRGVPRVAADAWLRQAAACRAVQVGNVQVDSKLALLCFVHVSCGLHQPCASWQVKL